MPSDEPAIRPEDSFLVADVAPPDRKAMASTTRRLWIFALLAALLAGFSGWGGGEDAQKRFPATVNELEKEDLTQARMINALKSLKLRMMRKKAVVAYGLLGGFLGLYLGLAGGLARRSINGAVKAAVVGLVLGAGAGAGFAYLLTPVYYRMLDKLRDVELLNDVVSGLAIHAGIWAPVGLAAGLALGLGIGGRDRIISASLGGVLGALIATAAFELIGGAAFPTAGTGHPVALNSSIARLMAHLLVAILVSIGAVLGAQHLRLRKSPAPIRG